MIRRGQGSKDSKRGFDEMMEQWKGLREKGGDEGINKEEEEEYFTESEQDGVRDDVSGLAGLPGIIRYFVIDFDQSNMIPMIPMKPMNII